MVAARRRISPDRPRTYWAVCRVLEQAKHERRRVAQLIADSVRERRGRPGPGGRLPDRTGVRHRHRHHRDRRTWRRHTRQAGRLVSPGSDDAGESDLQTDRRTWFTGRGPARATAVAMHLIGDRDLINWRVSPYGEPRVRTPLARARARRRHRDRSADQTTEHARRVSVARPSHVPRRCPWRSTEQVGRRHKVQRAHSSGRCERGGRAVAGLRATSTFRVVTRLSSCPPISRPRSSNGSLRIEWSGQVVHFGDGTPAQGTDANHRKAEPIDQSRSPDEVQSRRRRPGPDRGP